MIVGVGVVFVEVVCVAWEGEHATEAEGCGYEEEYPEFEEVRHG